MSLSIRNQYGEIFSFLKSFIPGFTIAGVSLFALFYFVRRMQEKTSPEVLKILKRKQTTSDLNQYEKMLVGDIIIPEKIPISFENIGGLEDIKQSLYETVIAPLLHPHIFQRGKLLKPPKGILLYGPPGTGKTMLVKAIAKETKCVFINLQISNLMNKWLGESEKLVAAIFSLAEKVQPCIIFIDEIDSLFGKRSEKDHEVTLRMKSLFMSLWDGLLNNPNSHITIIGCTNRPSAIDEALLRRMPHTFHIGLPNLEQREKILEVILKDEDLADNVNLKELAKILDGYSGSDLKALCEEAARAPIHEYLTQNKNKMENYSHDQIRKIEFSDFVNAKKVVQKTADVVQNYENLSFKNQKQSSHSASSFERLQQKIEEQVQKQVQQHIQQIPSPHVPPPPPQPSQQQNVFSTNNSQVPQPNVFVFNFVLDGQRVQQPQTQIDQPPID